MLVKVIALAEDAHALRRAAERVALLGYCAERGVAVPALIPTRSGGSWTRVETAGRKLFVYAMAEVSATPFAALTSRQRPDFFTAWGATVGALHAAVTEYPIWAGIEVAGRSVPLLHWQEEMDLFAHWLQDDAVRGAWQELRAALAELPSTREWLAFVHNDAHAHNFLLRSGEQQSVALDFDVANCHFLLTDVATTLYTQCDHRAGRPFPDAVLDDFFAYFLTAYQRHHRLPAGWTQALPLLMRYRDILVLCVFSNGLRGELTPQVRAWRDAVVAGTPLLSTAVLQRLAPSER